MFIGFIKKKVNAMLRKKQEANLRIIRCELFMITESIYTDTCPLIMHRKFMGDVYVHVNEEGAVRVKYENILYIFFL